MPVITPTEFPMSRPAHDQFERVIAEHYEPLKPDVLATVRGKLAVDNLHPDPSDLEAAYNAAWHALYEQSRARGDEVSNLGGWLATITYRRAIDDVRRARAKRARDRRARHRATGHLDASDEPVDRGLGAARSLRLRVRDRPLMSSSCGARRSIPADPCKRSSRSREARDGRTLAVTVTLPGCARTPEGPS